MSNLGMGRSQLNSDELSAYLLVEEALKKHSVSCDISGIPKTVDIMDIVLTVLGDNPDIIYFSKSKIRTLTSLFGKQLSFPVCMSKASAMEYESRLKKSLEEAV